MLGVTGDRSEVELAKQGKRCVFRWAPGASNQTHSKQRSFAAIFVCKILAGNLIEVFFVFSKYNLNFLVLVFTLAYICISTREQWCVAYRVWCAHLVSHFWELVVEICIALSRIIVVVDYGQWQYFCWLTNV